MGYTHYWYRPEKIDKETYKKIVDDFKKLLPEIEKAGVRLADGHGKGEPEINYDKVWFNGSQNCGHPKNKEIAIPWPTKDAGGIAQEGENVLKGNWFAGAMIQKRVCDGDCSYETFVFERVMTLKGMKLEDGKYFDFCKTAFRPYDLAVISFLAIAKHYLGDRIIVRSDGEDCHWFDGKLLCQTHLGYGLNFRLDRESARRQ